ncbi:MAG: 16S rRNA (cytosine(1402)-N(4))-methyltransferase RsmH [Thermacetogeniaceae bacterium]
MSELEHQPVMLAEALELLAVREGGTYLDCTLGGGGHAREMIRRAGPGGSLIGLDRDEDSLARAAANLSDFSSQVTLINSDYRFVDRVLAELGITGVDGVIFDLGVSTWQVLDPERGFSYSYDAALDMRMDRKTDVTAADLVNGLKEQELAGLIQRFGEERWAKRIASFITAARVKQPIATTGQLVEIIKAAIPAAVRRTGPHPAKRTFQALRIAVNDELAGLEQALRLAIRILKPGGRIVVISFHSLEDRIVKNSFRDRALSRDGMEPIAGEGIRILTRKPLRPGAIEVEQNPRARSAKLRAAEKFAGRLQ